MLSPKAFANMVGIRNPTPPGSGSSDDGSSETANSNRFSPLADDEDNDSKTTDVVPVYNIDESGQGGPKLVISNSKESLDSKESSEGGIPSEQDARSEGAASLIMLAQNSVSEKPESEGDQDFQKAGSN